MYILTLDIGGTQLRAALYPEGQSIPVRQKRRKTLAQEGQVTARLEALIAEIWPDDGPVRAIAAAVPGPLTPDGRILSAPNIPKWQDFNLRAHLQARFNVPVFIGNDANLATLGEWRYGAGQGHQHMLYLTISTGIGGGAICDGHLLTGKDGLGAEFGHVPLTPDGPICSCGHPGHLEAYASGTAIAAYVRQQLAQGVPSTLHNAGQVDAVRIAQAARQGDALSLQALQRAGFWLGVALSGFVHVFNPGIIVLGGGVSQSGDLLFGPMRETLSDYIFRNDYLENLVIAPATLGDDAGLLGALAFAHQNL